jgi:hypothetical protein
LKIGLLFFLEKPGRLNLKNQPFLRKARKQIGAVDSFGRQAL